MLGGKCHWRNCSDFVVRYDRLVTWWSMGWMSLVQVPVRLKVGLELGS
jgi:hypothetical protein